MLSEAVKIPPYRWDKSHFLAVKGQVSQGEGWTGFTKGQGPRIKLTLQEEEESQMREKSAHFLLTCPKAKQQNLVQSPRLQMVK